MQVDGGTAPSRRELLSLIGTVAGSAAMYHAMTSLGLAADSAYTGPIKLSGDVRGASVLILGAGLAGMTAALELRNAGYKVQILEFNQPSGRPQLDAARWRHVYRTRRPEADLRIRRRALFQSRPMADSLSPSRHPRLLQETQRRARAFRPAQSQCFPARLGRVRRETAAHPRNQSRFSGRGRRAPRQGDRTGQAR